MTVTLCGRALALLFLSILPLLPRPAVAQDRLTTHPERGLVGAAPIRLDSTVVRASAARTLADFLASRVAGLNVTHATGAPGYAPEVNARGTATMFGSARPALFIDGVQQFEDRHLLGQVPDRQRPSLTWELPLEEIESVDVVLGPTGGTLLAFGASRGAVFVTTRRPQGEAVRVRSFVEAGTIEAPASPAGLSTTTGVTASGTTDYCARTDVATGFCTPNGTRRFSPFGGSTPFSAGSDLRAGASASGALRGAGFRASVVADERRGQVARNDFSRLDLGGRVDLPRWKGTRSNVTARFARTAGEHARWSEDGLLMLGGLLVAPDDQTFPLPFRVADSLIARAVPYDAERLTLGASVTWPVRDWIAVHASGGLDRTNRVSDRTEERFGVSAPYPLVGSERARSDYREGVGSARLALRAERALGRGLRLAGEVGGHLVNKDRVERSLQEQFDETGTRIDLVDARQFPDVRSQSFFAAGRFFAGAHRSIGAGFRKETTKLFGRTFGDDPFNAVDLAWTASDERFFPRLPFLPRLHLRAAYGESGDHEVLLDLSSQGELVGQLGARLPRTREREVGADLGLPLGLALRATAFDRALRDGPLVTNATAPFPPLAFASWVTHGSEWTLSRNAPDDGALRVGGSLTWSSARTRITRWEPAVVVRTLFPGARTHYGEGLPFGALYTNGYSFTDANGDGVIDATEITLDPAETRRGVTTPTDVVGLTLDLRWQRWLRAGLALDGKFGAVKYDGGAQLTCAALVCPDLYRPEATLAEQARAVVSGYGGGPRTAPVHASDFVRVRELWMRFALPSSRAPRLLRDASLTVAVRQLAAWSGYPNGDPETGSYAWGTVRRGDYFTPRVPRTVSLRVDLAP